jgi:hypothetical protein
MLEILDTSSVASPRLLLGVRVRSMEQMECGGAETSLSDIGVVTSFNVQR